MEEGVCVVDSILKREPSLRERVASEIIRLVSIGELAPGSTLTEKRAAEMFGVSRTPAREALLKLSDSGILVTGTFKGFRVANTSSRDANWLYDCIVGIERQAVHSLAGKDYDKAQLRTAFRRSQERIDVGLFEYWLADREFHETIVSLTGNPHLVMISDYVRNALSRYITMYLTHALAPETSSTEHEEILNALLSDDIDDASRLITAHWNSARKQVTGWLRDDEKEGKDV